MMSLQASACEHLVVGVDREALPRAVEAALGGVDGGRDERRAHVLQGEAERGDLGRIDLDAHGRLLLAADIDLARRR